MEESYCLQYGEKMRGRSDKRFCNVECKNKYHNENSTEAGKTYKRVLKILTRNRNILKEVLGGKSTEKITMEKLEGKGYERDYFTHVKEVGLKKRKYYYLFDYGYRIEEDGSLKVVKAFA